MIKLKSLLSRANCALTEARITSFILLTLLMIIGGSSGVKAEGGLTDLGLNGYYHNNYGEYAYSFQGSATTLVKGAKITIAGSATSLDCWLSDNGTGNKWHYNEFSFELSADDVTKLKQTNYTFWMAAWYGTITKVTITLPNGTVVGDGGDTGGGNTTDPEGGEGGETPTPDDDPDADYSNQNDTDGDGVLEPTAENPAFGVKVNYHKYPQKTDVPTIYITTDAGQDVSNLYVTKTETYYTANIVVVDKNGKMKQRNEAVTFRGRGNSTWNSNSKKKPWRLKFPSKTKFLAEYDLSAGAEINNYANAKSWTLLSNVYDKSLMRNALTAELGKRYGLEFCPAYRFVDLFINGQYLGTYQVSDQVQVDPKRVNVSKTGWFIEHSTSTFAEDPYIMPKAGSQDLYVTVKNPETETVTASGESDEAGEGGAYYGMKQWLTQYWTSLTSGQYKTWRDQTDLKSLIGWIIIEELSGNYDGAMANVYAYKEADASKLKFGPLWDLDLAYGNLNTNGHFWDAQSQGIGFLFREMFKDPYFVKALYEQWTEFKKGDDLSNFISSKVSEISTLLAQTQAANYNMTEDSFHQYDSGWKIDESLALGSSASSYSAATSAITTYLLGDNGRISWIEKEYKKQYDALGCASLEDIDIDGDDEEGTGGEEGGGDDSSFNPTSTFEFTSATGGHNIPASAFSSKATKVQVTFTIPNESFWGFYGYNGSQWQAKSFNSVNNTITITIDDATDISTIAQNGITFELQNTNSQTISSAKLTVTVVNTMQNSGSGDTPEPSETFEQLTDLPTMYLQIYKLNEDGTSDKTKTETITTSGGAYHTARIVIVDENGTIKERDEETEIRGRGNSTWSGDNLKNPYRLKFPAKTKLLSYLDEDGTTVINNYANAKSWTLLANKGDYSLIRNALTAELGKYMNMPFVPAYKFVDLVVNGNYAGTYQISDQIQVAKDRVNVNSDTGWFLSANRGGGYEEDPYFTAGGATFNIKNPEADTPTANGETTDPKYAAMKTWMTNALQTKWINGTEVIDGEALANYFDIESLANFIVGIDITGDPDGGIDNFYMYREDDSSSKMKFGPMWDYDLAYGNAGAASRDYATKHFFADETYGWGYKVNQMYNTPTVIKAIWKRWKEVYGEYDSATGQSTLTKYLLAKVDALDAIIAQSQAKNFAENKAGSVAGSNTYTTHEAAIAALKAWIPAHIEWLNNAYKADYKKITGLDPDAECSHTYTGGKYTSNGDGTYSRECDICGMAEEGGTKVYKYITYANGTATETFNTSKTWATDNAPTNPNTLVVVDYGSGITGKNIVVDKNGTYTCANFELTDGYSFYSPIKFTATTATYTRNVSNDWGTICLPYKVQTVEADDATYYQLKKVGENNSTLVFEVATSSGAYTPLVFKRKSGSSITVTSTDVTVKATSEDKTNSAVADWTLIGTMEQKIVNNVKTDLEAGEELYYISNNKFWHATGKYTNNPFRAYFICTDATQNAKSFNISYYDDFSTNIEGIKEKTLAIFIDKGSISVTSEKNTVVKIHNISGSLITNTLVGTGECKTISLPAGLYIVNGTKVTVK